MTKLASTNAAKIRALRIHPFVDKTLNVILSSTELSAFAETVLLETLRLPASKVRGMILRTSFSVINVVLLLVGCRADSDCPPTQACINRECTDPCSYTQCGLNALCRADSNHKARCYCPDSFRGNPLVRCERPECVNDVECPAHLACQNERCENPCRCGASAICDVRNHAAICSCPPGFIGNPLLSCNPGILRRK